MTGGRGSSRVERLAEGFERVPSEAKDQELDRVVASLRAEAGVNPATLRAAVARLVEIALEVHWKRWAVDGGGDSPRPPALGDYAARFPELGQRADWPSSLIAHEYFLRLLCGDRPDRAAVLAQFPGRTEDLRDEFRRVEGEAARSVPAIPGYRELVEIGRGSMGVVYRAVHERLDRHVAIKVLSAAAFDKPSSLRRFRLEAEALAGLQHSHIVSVYDSGELGGRPYLVLEYVGGGSLKERLDRLPEPDRRLPPRLAAAMAHDLAAAAHRVHQEDVIHRDLKPGNVLLSTPPGVAPREAALDVCTPKLTDFGLVKRLDTAADETATLLGTLVGTPAYMAPEQARGESHAICPETDVYALGAILYELLTGRPPFVGPNIGVVLAQVSAVDPEPVRRLRREVDRDLENVVLKCLEKAPARRYRSARELAEDLERYLGHRPVLARPVGPLERAARWCGRNRPVAALLAAAAGVVLLALAVTALVSTLSARRAASSERLTYQTLSDVVGRIATDERLMRRGLGDLQGELLGLAMPRLESFRRNVGGPEADLLKGQALNHMVDVYRVRGQTAEALRTVDEAERHFATLAAGTGRPTPEVRYGLALARSARGIVLGRSRDRVDEGLVLLHDAAGQFAALRAEGWGDARDLRRRVALCWNSQGNCLRFRDPARAAAAYERALAEFQALADSDLADGGSRAWLVKTRSNLGLVRERLGRCAEGVREHSEAVRLSREYVDRARAAREEPSTPQRESWLLFDLDHREAFGVALTHLGELLARLGRLGEAESAFREALGVYTGLADAVPSYQEYPWSMAMARTDLGSVLSESGPGRWDEAETLFRQAGAWYSGELARLRAAGDEDKELLLYRGVNRFRAAGLVARRWMERGGPREPALAAARDACEILRGCGDGPEPRQWLGESLARQGDTLFDGGDPGAAASSWEQARSVLDALANDWPRIPVVSLLLASVEARLANSFARHGRLEDAESLRRRARRRLDSARSDGTDDPLIPRVEAEISVATPPPEPSS